MEYLTKLNGCSVSLSAFFGDSLLQGCYGAASLAGSARPLILASNLLLTEVLERREPIASQGVRSIRLASAQEVVSNQ